jgi:peroxiredoxin
MGSLAAGCAAGGGASGGKTAGAVVKESTTVGAPASDFTLRDLEGRQVHLSDYTNNKDVILLDFWATWCVPCEAELPLLEAMYKRYKDKGFVVLGIAMDGPETIAMVGPFARRYQLTFPVLLDDETKVVGVYNPKRTAPLTILIDRNGQIARARSGFSAGDDKLIEEDVRSLLQ